MLASMGMSMCASESGVREGEIGPWERDSLTS